MRTLSLLVLVAGLAAAAAPIPDLAASLDSALAARLGASPPASEASGLAKARKALAKYGGTEEARDLKRLASALAATDRSGTADAAVTSAADAILTALGDLALARKAEAEGIAGGLKLAKDTARVQKALNRGDAFLAAAGFATGRGAPARLVVKAVASFDKAKAQATKLFLKEIRKGVAGGGPDPGSDGATGTLTMLVGATLWVADEIAATWDAGTSTLAIRGTQHGTPDLTLELIVPGVTGPGAYMLHPGTGQYVTSVNGSPVDFHLTQSGAVVLGAIDGNAGTAAGTFSFTALSPYTGTITVPNGTFDLTGID